MVYYYTSKNVKLLRDIINDYEVLKDTSACEYMKTFIEKCPETIEDSKISWIVETFLSIHKHDQFHKNIRSCLSKELSEEDQNYFIIVFHGIVFQITPKDMNLLYKCLFNLSKSLLNIYTNFLCSEEVLNLIAEVAQSYYDTSFITDRIIGPLFLWQPYLQDMAQKYKHYIKKIEYQKIKQPTVPISPKVLNRNKTFHVHPVKEPLPSNLPNLLLKKTKMLTKSKIDQKLKESHEANKQKAIHLLQNAKNMTYNYAKEKTNNVSSTYKIENENAPKLKSHILKNTVPPIVKETTTTLKRIDKRIKLSQKEELQWLEDLMTNCRNTTKVEELVEYDRQERERERLLDIERKHLLGQISYEDALIAKKKLFENNKKKYDDFMKEKRLWEEDIEMWKRNEMEKNRKQVEKLSLIELDMLHAKNNNIARKKEIAYTLKKESEELLAKAFKEKQDELDNKIKMIKELKILAMIAKKVKAPKIIDLTESSGLGFLCEMSIAELQEKLNIIKIELKEELDRKRKNIHEQKQAAKKDLEETKKDIETYMSERAYLGKQKKIPTNDTYKSSNQIHELKKVLEEKRNLRIKLST